MFFFSLFLPGADLQINIEYARKLLNYSCTELFKRIWERQSPWIYLLAQKLCVIYWQERDSPHSFYLPVSSMFPGEVSQNAFSTTQFHPSWCLSFLSPNWKAPSPSIVKQRAEIHTINIHEQTPIHHHSCHKSRGKWFGEERAEWSGYEMLFLAKHSHDLGNHLTPLRLYFLILQLKP